MRLEVLALDNALLVSARAGATSVQLSESSQRVCRPGRSSAGKLSFWYVGAHDIPTGL